MKKLTNVITLFFILCWSGMALAGPAVIYNGQYVKALKDQLKLNNSANIMTGTADPTSVAKSAPLGSIYLRQSTPGEFYVKQDTGSSTNWSKVVLSNGVLTANRGMKTDASGNVISSTVTDAELEFLAGVSSNVQTQLNAKLENVVEDATPSLGGPLDVNGSFIVSSANGDIVMQPNGTGDIAFQDGSEGTAGHVWTSSTTGGDGSWAALPVDEIGANDTLSNLGTTSINSHLLPQNNSRNIGSFTDDWSTLFLSNAIFLLDSGGSNNAVIYGSTGSAGFRSDSDGAFLKFDTEDVNVDAIDSGYLLLETGAVTKGSSSNDTGYLLLETGTTSGSGDTGAITLKTGAPNSGTQGTINLIDGSEGTIGHVWTSTGVLGSGNWAAIPEDTTKADVDLGNLTSPTAVNQALIPDGTTRDFGTAAAPWNVLFGQEYRLYDTSSNVLASFEPAAIGDDIDLEITGALYDLNVLTADDNNAAANITGEIFLETGDLDNVGSSGTSGGVQIRTGAGAGTSDSGDISVRPGSVTSGNRGTINLIDGSEGTIGHVWTSTGVLGQGNWAAAGGGGATTELDNLGTTAINADLIPDGITRDLGTSTDFWADIHARELDLWNAGGTQIFEISDYLGFGIGVGVQALVAGNEIYMNTAAQATSGDSGDIIIESGDGTGTNTGSGEIRLETGAKTGTGVRGKITFKDGTEGTDGHVWTQSGTTGEGNWEAAAAGGQPAQDDISEGDLGTITWLGTPPGGTTTKKYKCITDDNIAHIWVDARYSSDGSNNSRATFDLPGACATPTRMSNIVEIDQVIISFGSGFIFDGGFTRSAFLNGNEGMVLVYDTTDGYELSLGGSGLDGRGFSGHLTYRVD